MFRRRPRSQGASTPVQGTQAAAAAHMESNQKYFKYPPEGFVSPVEHSLLYAMINEPTIYPPSVIYQAIEEQDFTDFFVVKKKIKNPNGMEEEVCSYAQLSALLSLAMQKWPDTTTTTTTAPSSNHKLDNRQESSSKATTSSSVPQVLCQALLRAVVQYANQHELDREHEIAEFLNPAVERTKQRLDNAANYKMNLPLYAGLALSVATGNPLPMYLGTFVVFQTMRLPRRIFNQRKLALT